MLKELSAIISIIFGIFLTAGTGQCEIGIPYHVNIEPNLIHIGAGYHGTEIHVKGEIPEDTDIIIQLTDEPEDSALLKKGHVGGVLWMNTGSVTFSNIPKVYILNLPGTIPVSMLFSDREMKKLNVGFDALERKTSITPEGENKPALFKELIKLKTHEGLYAQQENTISYQEIGDGIKSFSCNIAIPSRIKPGAYTIKTSLVRNKSLILADSHQIKIAETGFPEFISGLAFGHGALYGVLATAIALIAGFLIGLIFEGGGSH